jgi:3'-phosphoadenosine 5'-phosphosulfate sulfotransferase (PAPS reductase)/FAD synthetase
MMFDRQTIQIAAERHNLAIDGEIVELLMRNAAIGIGVSGGKDSDAMALAVARFLDEIEYEGPKVLIHADLGEIEHADSLPQCQRLAAHLGLELIVVRRLAGGMIERWEQRWRDNAARYINLQCVTLITPWSSAAMRFCTSELKVAPITRELSTRFHGLPIINAVGIRSEESESRSRKPISQLNEKLLRAGGLGGRDWYPIKEWKLEEVWAEHDRAVLAPHEAYSINGNTRVSCALCVLASLHDLQASLKDARNHRVYQRLVNLEIQSAFSFQPARWLGDVRPDLLDDASRDAIEQAKLIAARRREIEKRIPLKMRYVKGWPTFVPDHTQSGLLAEVRREIRELTGLPMQYLTASAVRDRYRELFEENRYRKGRTSRTCQRVNTGKP